MPTIAHSESKSIEYFKNEAGPGVLKYSVHERFFLKNFTQHGQTPNIVFGIHAVRIIPESWTGAP